MINKLKNVWKSLVSVFQEPVVEKTPEVQPKDYIDPKPVPPKKQPSKTPTTKQRKKK